MKKRLTLICGVILIISSFTGCGSNQGTSSAEKKPTEKLALTKENLNSVFKDYNYNVSVGDINDSTKSLTATFNAGENVERGKEKEELEKIEAILHKKFDINENDSDNSLICMYNGKIIVSRYFSKIEVGEKPEIHIENKGIAPSIEYKLGSEFNMLKPYRNLIVSARDKEDGDITDKIKFKNPEILKKECTNGKLIYEVTDSDGNVGTEEFFIDVVK